MKKILIIDDTEAIQNLIRINLLARGYTVISAFNGVEGLETAHKGEPDLIILDLMLPDIPGWDLLSKLKNDIQLSNIPVFVMTASEFIDDDKKAVTVGADCYFSKPFLLHTLLTKIEEFIDR
jgi:two-component system, OmpR family, response regulator ArlR